MYRPQSVAMVNTSLEQGRGPNLSFAQRGQNLFIFRERRNFARLRLKVHDLWGLHGEGD